MAVIRHIVEHLIPLIFGAILAFFISHFRAEIEEHFDLWLFGFIILFLLYSYGFEGLKRVLFFLIGRRRKVCGAYVEVYARELGNVVVAPYLVLHDLRRDELCAFGRAFLVNAQGRVQPTSMASWTSTALALSEVKGSTRELAYLFVGQSNGVFNIHGTTRVGVPATAWGDTSVSRGYFIDTDISEPAFGVTGNKPFAPITELDKHVDAVRFYSIKFDKPSYRAFVGACEGVFDRLLLRLRLFREPSEAAFVRFLESTALRFLAERTPTGGVFADISHILKAAAGAVTPSPDGSKPGAAAPVVVAANPQPATGADQIDGTG